jgi:hypothetical protein
MDDEFAGRRGYGSEARFRTEGSLKFVAGAVYLY